MVWDVAATTVGHPDTTALSALAQCLWREIQPLVPGDRRRERGTERGVSAALGTPAAGYRCAARSARRGDELDCGTESREHPREGTTSACHSPDSTEQEQQLHHGSSRSSGLGGRRLHAADARTQRFAPASAEGVSVGSTTPQPEQARA